MNSVVKRLTVAFMLLAGVVLVGTSSVQAASRPQSVAPITISSTSIYTGHGTNSRVGTLTQTYDPNSRSTTATWWPAGWDSIAGVLDPINIWLENGPNTHVLTAATLPANTIDASSTLPYYIDVLPYPKTMDAAIHITYEYLYIDEWGDMQTPKCDVWVAGATHDYSTGATYGGQTKYTC